MEARRSRTIRPAGGASAVALSLLTLASPALAGGGRKAGDSLASASAPAATALSLERARKGAARYGGTVALTATLTSGGKPLAGKAISLEAGGAPVASAVTDARGEATFKLKASRNASYEARFAPVSAEDVVAYQPAGSGPLAVAVRPVVKLKLSSPLRAGRKAVGVPGVRLRIKGRVRPYVAGAEVVVRVTRRGRQVLSRTQPVVQRGSSGRFRVSFKPARRATYIVRAAQRQTAEFSAGDARPKRLLIVRPRARSGSHGPAVRALQRRLSTLGYATRVNGHFGTGTARAVLAFRKVNGLRRAPAANRAVFRRLAKGRGAFRVRYPKGGKHVEFDWSRQVLVLARGARPVKVLHASSGKASTPTVFGHFRFYSKTPGYNSKEMYYSNYFVGGYAIHGYASVPNYPASHGCIRIPIPSAISVYRWIRSGNRMFVYR